MDREFRTRWLREAQRSHGNKVRFATDSPVEGAGFEPSVPRRLQAKTPRFGIVLRRPLSSCGSFHIDHRLSCHVSPLIEFGSVSACASWRIPVVMGYAPGCFRGMKRDAVPGMSINGGQASV